MSGKEALSAPERHLRRLAFGLERMGLVALLHPIAVGVVIVVLAVAAAFGVQRIQVDDSLSQLFRSNTPAFKQYEEVTKNFPSSEFDVLVVVEGDSLLQRDSLDKLRTLVTDLQLIEGTRGIISIFSAREPPEAGHIPPPLFPDTLPEGAAYDAFIQKVKANEIFRGKLLAEDGKLTLVVLSLEPKVVRTNELGRVVAEIRSAMRDDLAGTGLNSELSGVPVMQLAIRNAVERDRIDFTTCSALPAAA